jgi:BirA family transcriptional regulator, biotin operon repressor / biotin---[acetyl-CoA-carboxylase] ligase
LYYLSLGVLKIFNVKKFKGLIDTTFLGRNIRYFAEVSSTNDYALKMLAEAGEGHPESIDGTVVVAEKQTCARGRFNRSWLSPRGGLWFSLIFRSPVKEDRIPVLTLIAAFSIADVLKKKYGIYTNIKWPNDLYYRDRKLGGILSESKKAGGQQMVVMGIGINIDLEEKYLKILEGRAVNIKDITTMPVEPEPLLASILKNFEGLLASFPKTGLKPVIKKIGKILRI